jgi:peptide/nickel transport system permease protein
MASRPDNQVLSTPTTGSVPGFTPEVASRGRLVLQRVLRDWRAITGLATVVILVVLAYVAPFFVPWDCVHPDMNSFLLPPSRTHWFGTTGIGHDVFALTMCGMQKSVIVGLAGALMATAVAAIVGAFAGYFGGRLNIALNALVDLLLVLPSFLIIAILSPTFQDRSWLFFVLLLAGFQWMITARIVRGMTLSIKEKEFIRAAEFMGVKRRTIVFRHILPNMASILIIDATVNVSSLILAEVGLAFFGFGIQPPEVSLGTIIGESAGSALSYPWQFYFPAGFLVALVLAINLVGDGLRDAIDPNSVGAAR